MYPQVWELGKIIATREKQRKPHGHWTHNGQCWTTYSREWRWSQWRKSVDKGTENADQSVISFIPKHHFPTPSHTLLWDPLLLDTHRPMHTLPRDRGAVRGICRCAHVLAMPQQHCTTSVASLLWTRLWGFREEQDQVSPSRNQTYGGADCKPTRRWMKEWGELVSVATRRNTPSTSRESDEVGRAIWVGGTGDSFSGESTSEESLKCTEGVRKPRTKGKGSPCRGTAVLGPWVRLSRVCWRRGCLGAHESGLNPRGGWGVVGRGCHRAEGLVFGGF